VIGLIASGHDPFMGMNAGFVGLAINSLVTLLVSLRTRPTDVKELELEDRHDR
jgi:SSS family solute:Na+ symporter